MLKAGSGAIVMTCSVNARLPDPAVLDYSAAESCTSPHSPRRCPRKSGRAGIRVNTVSPGPVATDLWLGHGSIAETISHATGAKPAEVESQAAAGSATGRFSQPNEVASLIAYLASDLAANITGADFAHRRRPGTNLFTAAQSGWLNGLDSPPLGDESHRGARSNGDVMVSAT